MAAGYQDGNLAGEEKILVTAGATFGQFNVGAGYGDNDGTAKWRLSGSANVAAGTSVTAFVADDESASDTLWGLGFAHDIGGATLVGGVVGDENGDNQADLGLKFKF